MFQIGFIPGLKFIVYAILFLINGFVLIFLSSYYNMVLLKTMGALTIIVSVFPFMIGFYLYIHFKLFGPSFIHKVSNEAFMDIVLKCMLSIAMYKKNPRNVDAYRVKRIYKLMFDYEPPEHIIYKTSEKMYSNGFNLQNYLRNKFRFIEKPLRVNVFKACYLLCHQDKYISDEEEKILYQIANLLSISKNHRNSAIREINLTNYKEI